jgi:hypothetical protein
MILYLKFFYWTFDWRATPVDVRRAADGIGVWAWLRGNIDLKSNFKVQISKKLHHYGRDWTGGSRVELIVGRLVWRCTVLSIINLIFSCEVRSFYFACWYAAGDGWLKHKKLKFEFWQRANTYGATRRIWCCCWDEGMGGRRPLGAGGRKPLKNRMIDKDK